MEGGRWWMRTGTRRLEDEVGDDSQFLLSQAKSLNTNHHPPPPPLPPKHRIYMSNRVYCSSHSSSSSSSPSSTTHSPPPSSRRTFQLFLKGESWGNIVVTPILWEGKSKATHRNEFRPICKKEFNGVLYACRRLVDCVNEGLTDVRHMRGSGRVCVRKV